jgi:hypothetical protein
VHDELIPVDDGIVLNDDDDNEEETRLRIPTPLYINRYIYVYITNTRAKPLTKNYLIPLLLPRGHLIS